MERNDTNEPYLKEIVLPYSPLPSSPLPSSPLYTFLKTFSPSHRLLTSSHTSTRSTFSTLKSHCTYTSHGLYTLPSPPLTIRPLPQSSLDYFSTLPITLTFHTSTPPSYPKISSTSYLLPPLIPSLEIRYDTSSKPSLIFNTGISDLLASSVPDLQNRGTTEIGKRDERILKGDCWSEFRQGYVKDGMRKLLS
ncbi:hypothetical protein TrST_g2233 [Triparma strigata]|uniref:Uncharacterized protein n=1 Tax=Triparma strigata TaxID=1606541 RepID=A0A9W7ALV5_9STRA|nr:hypothetical protein TrST_g2233 [Triparma strigata]